MSIEECNRWLHWCEEAQADLAKAEKAAYEKAQRKSQSTAKNRQTYRRSA